MNGTSHSRPYNAVVPKNATLLIGEAACRRVEKGGTVVARSSSRRWLQIEPVGDVSVVKFTQPDILDLEVIRVVGEQLLGLADEGRQVVLDFGQVKRLSTALVGKVVALHKRLNELGGQLALCQVAPHLREALELLKLPRLVPIYGEEREALEGMERSKT
jgi:anti-anti-sigma regulatory factor